MKPFPFSFPPIKKNSQNYNSSQSNFSAPSYHLEHEAPPCSVPSSDYFSNSNKKNSEDEFNHNLDNKLNNTFNNALGNNLFSNNDCSKIDEDFFDFLGLQLHFDDLLIIAIMFFLYQENVTDTYLYIALILLLLS